MSSFMITLLQGQRTALVAQLVKVQADIAGLVDLTISAYTFDDGQTTQRATRESLPDWITKQEHLLNQIAVIDNRLTGEGTLQAGPAW